MPNLVGIGNSQVPTNAMLGGLAYQNSVGEIDIEKVKARVSDRTGAGTLYKIFVYNTKNENLGITSLLQVLREEKIKLSDIKTEQSSLENIFVNLLKDSENEHTRS